GSIMSTHKLPTRTTDRHATLESTHWRDQRSQVSNRIPGLGGLKLVTSGITELVRDIGRFIANHLSFPC
ncbi:MAG: hypothetical protein ABIR91_02235, partial [Candidatus Saccharimonadales bacterium]